MPAPAKTLLIALATDRRARAQLRAWCDRLRQRSPGLEEPALSLCRLLCLAGLEVPFGGNLSAQLRTLRTFGWRFVSPVREPLPGDLWVIEDGAEQPVRVGVVTKRLIGFSGERLPGVELPAAAARGPIRPRDGERFAGWLTFG